MVVVRHVGFTGTQQGMTQYQKETLEREFRSLDFALFNEWWFHHGDCIGADEEADKIARAWGAKIWIHPPVNQSKRANCGIRPNMDKIVPGRPYLQRNQHIVEWSDMLFACPAGEEKQRSGTWSTVRKARALGKDHMIIMPDGSVI